MHVRKSLASSVVLLAFLNASLPQIKATPRKVHVVALGAVRRVPYSKTGDPAGAAPGEDALKVRPLVLDGAVKEWTTGDAHDVTDRSFVVRRVLRLNDELPGEKSEKHWVWQRGPWLLVDRKTGHITALKLPDYDPGVSQGHLVPRLRRLLRSHGNWQKPLRRRCPVVSSQTGSGEEANGLRFF